MPSSRSYSIVEPHPSVVPSKSYILSGRGGAGNITKAPNEVTLGPTASGPAARASQASLSKPRSSFVSGRGGAGNIHHSSERAIFSFDEELERQLTQEKHVAPVYHVGRGGAGNITQNRNSSTSSSTLRRDSESSGRSNSSAESGADIATRKFRQGLKRMTGAF